MMKRKTLLLACLAMVMAACTTAAPDTTGGATDTTAAGGTETTAPVAPRHRCGWHRDDHRRRSSGRDPGRCAGARHSDLRGQRRRPRVWLCRRRRQLLRIRHRLLQGGCRRGPRRSGGGGISSADHRAAVHRPPIGRGRRAHPKHDAHRRARRRAHIDLPHHHLLRRPGDDGAGRQRVRSHRRHDRHRHLHAVGDHNRGEPGGPDGRHCIRADHLRGERADPGGLHRRPVRRLDF